MPFGDPPNLAGRIPDDSTSAPPPVILATRRMLPMDADTHMVLHAQVFLATHALPPREDRAAQQQWLKGLYRVMASAGPAAILSDEDMVHALAFHCGLALTEVRGQMPNISRMREACESALSGLRFSGV